MLRPLHLLKPLVPIKQEAGVLYKYYVASAKKPTPDLPAHSLDTKMNVLTEL
jgi:hypothetical protein